MCTEWAGGLTGTGNTVISNTHHTGVSKAGCLWLALAASLSVCLPVCLCLPVWLSGSSCQPNGESFHCLTAIHTHPPLPKKKWGDGLGWQGQAKQRRWPHRPEPLVVTSNAGIPETRGRCKQGWALSKRGSQCRGVGLSWNWGETEKVLCQDCDTEYQWNSAEDKERQGGGIRGGPVSQQQWKQHRAATSASLASFVVNSETLNKTKWTILIK